VGQVAALKYDGPVTYVNLDLAASALRAFEAESDDVAPGETVSIMEITMRNLLAGGEVDLEDFLSRADVLATTGHTVMISDFAEYYRLAASSKASAACSRTT
jgi:hypothetical protein